MTLTSHAVILGSILPVGRNLFLFFEQSQTFRAKIRPFPWMKFENILPSNSAYLYNSLKKVKFMVGQKVVGA